MTADAFHPLVFGVLCASVASAAVFAWLTGTLVMNHRIQHREGDRAYAWFTATGAFNSAMVVATFVPMAAAWKADVFRLIWVTDCLAVAAWVGALTTFLAIESRLLHGLRWAIAAVATIPATDLVLNLLTGHSAFFSPVPRPSTWPLLLASGNVYSHRPLADATALAVVSLTVTSALVLLHAIRTRHPTERMLMAGVVVTTTAALSEAVLGGSGTPIPLIFLANHLEAMRITWSRTRALGSDLEAMRQVQADQDALIAHQLHQLRLSERLARVGEQTATITHDLRNPLGAVIGGLELLEELHDDPDADPEEIRQATTATRSALDHVMVLVRRVTRQARQDEDDAKRTLPLSRVVEDALALARHRVQHIPLTIEVPPDLVLTGRHTGLVQLLMNLVVNAAIALERVPTPWIRIRAATVGDVVRVTVTDAGTRPPDAVLDRMFTSRFTTRTDGTGLGLHICAQIVGEHGGRIHVDRKAPNTTFVVELPALLAMDGRTPLSGGLLSRISGSSPIPRG